MNTKRERRSTNNKDQNKSDSSKQPIKTQTFTTLGALVSGFTGTSNKMSGEINQTDTLTVKSIPTVINGQSNDNTIQVQNPNKNECYSEKIIEQSSLSSSSHIDHGIDSGLSSEITNTEIEKITVDDELSSTSAASSTIFQTNPQCETNPNNGVVIPEEKRVTERVKVFEAVANYNENHLTNKNINKKKSLTSSSFSIGDHKEIPSSSVESFDTQSINETKSSKNKSKKSSLKKQIQNLLKIDKSSTHDELNCFEEQIIGKKNKKDHSKK